MKDRFLKQHLVLETKSLYLWVMSPTVFRYKGYRFFFFSREESRIHIHIISGDGEAKFWVEPEVALANNYGLSAKEIRELERIVKERQDEIERSWRTHFPD